MVRRFAYANGKIVPVWSEEEKQCLKEMFPSFPTRRIAEKLGRTESAVTHKAARLALHKNHFNAEKFNIADRLIGYIAAAIDGEGTIRLHREKGTRSNSWGRLTPEIRVVNTNKEFILKLQKAMSGYIYKSKRKKPAKTCYTLIVRGVGQVYSILSLVTSELTVKRRLAELLLAFCERRLNREKQTQPYDQRDFEIYNEMRSK
jgi:hypothetical protein